MYRESLNYHNSQMVSKSQDIQAINEAYMNVYEAKKKVDQDVDGDNDFADVMIARMIAAGIPREEAIRRVKDKSYNEEYEIEEKFVSPFESKPTYKNIQGITPAMRALNKSDELQRTQPGSQRQRIQTRRSTQLYRLFHSARTAGGGSTLQNAGNSSGSTRFTPGQGRKYGSSGIGLADDFELWVGSLLDEGYDLSDYTVDEMYKIYEETFDEAVLGRDVSSKDLRPASVRTSTELTSTERARRVAAERRARKKQEELERLANSIIAKETGTAGRRGTGKAVKPREEPSTDKPTPEATTRKLSKGQKKDTAAAKAAEIIAALRSETERTHKRGAEVLKQVQKEELEIYEELVNYLLEYSYADDINEACTIIDNSSDAWLEQILEEIGLID